MARCPRLHCMFPTHPPMTPHSPPILVQVPEFCPVGTIHLMAGPIPITLKPCVQFDAAASYELNAEGKVTAGIDYAQHLMIGTQFRSAWNEFRTIKSMSLNKPTLHPPTINFKASASLEVAGGVCHYTLVLLDTTMNSHVNAHVAAFY